MGLSDIRGLFSFFGKNTITTHIWAAFCTLEAKELPSEQARGWRVLPYSILKVIMNK